MATFPSDSVRTKNWGTEILTDADLEGQLDLLHEYLKAALNSSTGHTHDGTSNQSPKLTSGAVGATFVSGLTTVTGVGTDYVMIADASDSNAPKKALASDFTYTPTAANALAGSVVQTVNTQSGAVITATMGSGNTVIGDDDSIPQISEGILLMTRAITPTSATNVLLIEVIAHCASDTANDILIGGLFQDSTANAIAASYTSTSAASVKECDILSLRYYMVAGTTSSTSFTFRGSTSSGAVFTFNGTNAGRKLGGVMSSSITITEIKV